MTSNETRPLPRARAHERAADSDSTTSFGLRVEKILYVAEQEAAETRRSATRESTAMIERARVESEAVRREGEQAVAAFQDEAERLADQRATELDSREREIDWIRENARIDADRRLDEAHREADRIVGDAIDRAEAVRAEIEAEVEQRRAEVERQMAWLEESRRAARDLAQMLLAQVGDEVRRDDHGPEPHDEDTDSVPEVPETPEVPDAPETLEVPHEARLRRAHSPAVVPPAELRFAGSFGGILGPVDESREHWDPRDSLDYSDASTERWHRGRTA